MPARRPSLLPVPLALLWSVLLGASLALLPSVAGSVQAGMIGTGLAPRAVAVGDLNEDGYADLVSGNTSDSTVSVSLGRGNGTFKPKVQYSCGSSVTGVTIADLNGDGHLDIAGCCPAIGKIGLRFGAGDGTLGARTDIAVNTPTAVVVGDFDENGIPDLAVACTGVGSPGILLGTGGGAFAAPTHYAGTGGPHLAVGDVNNDNHLDVAVTNNSVFPYGVAVMLGTGTGTLGSPTLHVMPDMVASVAIADFNTDGKRDLAAAVGSANNVYIKLGNGDGSFGANTAYSAGSSPSGIAVADLNGDTKPDLVVTNANNVAAVLLGTGTGAFNPKVDYPAGVTPRGVAIGQLDGDANFDLAIAASGSNSICTLPGNGNGTFQVPSGPVYVWANASGLAFDPAAWLPARNTGTASDILVFNRGGAVTVSSVPTATVGQLVFSGGTEASFSGLSGTATLTVAGGTGDDAVVEQGSKTVLASSGSPVSVNLAIGARAEINGDVEIRGGNSRFQALDPSGIVFQSTGRAIIGAGSSGTPFGDGTNGASGFNSVRFLFGSVYIAQTTVAVFGASAPNAVVVFGPGSRFRMDAAFTPAASGRTYGDFEYNVPAGSSAISGGSPFQVDSLIITQGTFTVAMTGPVTIRGNIVISACSGPDQLVFAPATPATYKLGGNARQLMYSTAGCFGNRLRVHASPNVTFNLDNPGGMFLTQGWRTAANFNFTRGNLGNVNGWQIVTDSTATITGAAQSTGWIETQQTRRVSANGPVHFDVGDSAHYLPMDVDVHGVTAPGYVLAGMYAADHPGIAGAQLDLAHLVHRSWVMTASNDFGNLFAPTFFSNLDATFRFLPSDVDPGSDPLQFEVRQNYFPGPQWRATTPGLRTATSIQALGMSAAVVDSFQLLVAGQPITPSLSVFNASAAEGNGPAAPVQVDAASAPASLGPIVDLAGPDASEFGVPLRRMFERSRLSAVGARPMQVQSAGSLSFRVRLSQAAIVPVSVHYETADGSATAGDGDYVPASGTLSFAPGDTALDVVVPFGADATPERNETFGITLSNPSNASIAAPSATGTILDDDDLVAPTAQVTYPNGGEVIHQGQSVDLQWTATDNVAISGVDIQLVNGASVTTLASNYPNTGSYPWTASGTPSIKMKFRVVAHDDPGHATTDNSDANWELSAYVIGVDEDLPLAFALPAPTPNPTPAGRNRITFAVPHEARVRLTIHDVRGRRLASLADGTLPAGHHVRTWNSAGVAAGVYFIRFEAPGFHSDRRLVVVR